LRRKAKSGRVSLRPFPERARSVNHPSLTQIIQRPHRQRPTSQTFTLARQSRNQILQQRPQAADGDAVGVIEYSRGQSAFFARRPRLYSSTPSASKANQIFAARKEFNG
jgi:hypothetical protein